MKSNRYHIISTLTLVILLFSLHSCIKEEFDPDKLDLSVEFSPGVALPLGYVHYELEKLLADSSESKTIKIDDDGLITIVYSQELVSFRADELITIDDVSYNSSINNNSVFPIDLSILAPVFTITDTIQISLGLSEYSEIDSIHMESMNLAVRIDNSNNLNGNGN